MSGRTTQTPILAILYLLAGYSYHFLLPCKREPVSVFCTTVKITTNKPLRDIVSSGLLLWNECCQDPLKLVKIFVAHKHMWKLVACVNDGAKQQKVESRQENIWK